MSTSSTRPTPPLVMAPGRSIGARWRLLLIVVLNIIVIVIIGTASVITLIEQREAIKRLHISSVIYLRTAADQALEDVQLALVTASTNSANRTGSEEDAAFVRAELDALRTSYPAILSLDVVNAAGDVVTHVPVADSLAVDWRDHPAYLAAAVGELYVGPMESAAGTLIVAVPGADSDSAIIAQVDSAMLWSRLVNLPVGTEGYAYLVDSDGWILGDDSTDPVTVGVFEDTRDGGTAMSVYQGRDGWVVGRAERWSILGVTVITETPLSQFTPVVVRLIGLWGLALIFSFGVGEWLMRRMLSTVAEPLNKLSSAAQAIKTGDYSYRVRLPNVDREFAELGTTFNDMIRQLAETQRQLDAYTNEMQEIVDHRARELWRKTTQMEIAAEVSSTIGTIHDPRVLVVRVAELIKSRFELYHVEILLVDEDTGRIVPGNGAPAGLGALSLHDATSSVIAWVASSGEMLYVPDVTDEPRYRRSEALPASRSELAIPLRVEGNVLGVLNMESEHRDAFLRDQIEVLAQLANEIAVSIQNAQSFSALERSNSDLAQATMQANQANILKSRFLYHAAEKLRAPLVDIVSTAEMLLSGVVVTLPPQAVERQRTILDNGRVMQALIEDMLDLSAIEAGHLQLNLEWITLPPLLDEVTNAARALHMAAHPDHDLTIRLDLMHLTDPLPTVWADLDRLRYILITLMSNAVKFTEAGEVVISADMQGKDVVITIQDTGAGISDEELRYMFEPFQQQKAPIIDHDRGTGLGLPVARLLAMRHGGDLTVETQEHAGTTFILRLPCSPDGAPPRPDA